MKKTLALLLTLTLLLPVLSPAAAEEKEYTVQAAPLWEGDAQTGTLDLRFYPAAPHVPYYGMKAYLAFLMDIGLTVAEDNGTWTVTHPNGSYIRVKPAEGAILAPDWAAFQNPPLPYAGRSVGVKDAPCAWSVYEELSFDDAPAPVLFDFAKYGIPLYADADDVYLPLALLSTLFNDIALNYVLYNGEKVFRPALDFDGLSSLPAGYYESEPMRALLTGEAEREEDVIRESYAELCFILDYCFGHPGVALLDEAIAEKGLDQALKDLEGGQQLLDLLLSPDMVQYLIGMCRLFGEQLDDGHSAFTGINDLFNKPVYPEILAPILTGAYDALVTSSNNYRMMQFQAIRSTRDPIWGPDAYRECGSTAILRIDSFMPDAAGWEAYYAGTGEIPRDALGITWTGLKKASENPDIKNVLFDLSANMGGSGDQLMAILDLAVGDGVFRGYNTLTGQREHTVIRTDKNLDGVIDDKDQAVRYDFRYAVLTTRASFSCGNLFPVLMQENGAVLIGEPSGGGSCCVQTATLTGGAVFMMSSYIWSLRTEAGDASLEDGCQTDLPIPRTEPATPNHTNPKLTVGDYTAYFDGEALDRMINEWFEQAEVPAA